MSTVYELHHLLRNLVHAWPEDDDNPILEEARNYLQGLEQTVAHNGNGLAEDQNESYHDAMWYSI